VRVRVVATLGIPAPYLSIGIERPGNDHVLLQEASAEGSTRPHPPHLKPITAAPPTAVCGLGLTINASSRRSALSGDWTIDHGASVLNGGEGRIAFRFHARDVHLVMGRPAPGTSVPFRVLVDGQRPGDAHGLDVDEQGHGTVSEQRLY
jgi:hypothetical protein